MTEFTPVEAIVGGLLIGLGAVMMMAMLGRVAGVSGILGGVLFPSSPAGWSWRALFIVGMIVAPAVYTLVQGHAPPFEMMSSSTALTIISGVLVGIGVTFGSGCASGHGVCGLARLSPRSISATAIFMLAAGVTVFVMRHVIGA